MYTKINLLGSLNNNCILISTIYIHVNTSIPENHTIVPLHTDMGITPVN